MLSVAYRVEELAAAAGVSVELLRSYQTKGLIDPPRRDGRVALYDDRHLERLRTIKELKDKGYSLKAISGLLTRQHGDSQRSVSPLPPVSRRRAPGPPGAGRPHPGASGRPPVPGGLGRDPGPAGE